MWCLIDAIEERGMIYYLQPKGPTKQKIKAVHRTTKQESKRLITK
jgi:hypothetical protein